MSNTRITGRHFVAGQWLAAGRDTFPEPQPGQPRRGRRRLSRAGTATAANDAVAAARAAYPAWRRTSRILRAELFDRLAQLIKRETDDLADADGPRVRQGRHRVPGRGGRRAAHGAVRLRHRPDADRRGRSPPRSPRRTPSCAASRGASSRSSRRGTSRSRCRCGCSGRACSKATRPSSSRRRTRRRSASGWSSCSSRPASRRASINLVHGDGEVGEALVQQPGRERRAVHRQLRGRQAHPAGVGRRSTTASSPPRWAARARSSSARTPGSTWRSTPGIISAFKTTGQRCVSAGRILVHETLIDRFAEGVRRRRRSGCGSATRSTPTNFTGPVINEAAVEKVLSYNALAKEEGGDGPARRRPADRPAPTRRAATCRRSSTAWSTSPGVRCDPRGGVRPARRADPVQDERGRGADLQRHRLRPVDGGHHRELPARCGSSATSASTAWAT